MRALTFETVFLYTHTCVFSLFLFKGGGVDVVCDLQEAFSNFNPLVFPPTFVDL